MVFGLNLATALAASWVAHGVHPRTPVIWDEDGACMTVVDRSVTPVVELTYTIPYEDTDLHEDEPADSRRQQFLALCHDYPRLIEAPPTWISRAEVDKTAASGVEGSDLLDDVTADDILEESPRWQGCWTRITGDDERRPITWEAAKEPVLWDISGLPVGPQVVFGYTWEPIFNIWSRRPGVLQIVDDLDLAATPPAIAVSTVTILSEDVDDVPLVEGCVRAMEGSTITGLFTVLDWPQAPEWIVFAADVPVVGGDFSLPLVVPAEALRKELAVRVEVVDPLGRRHSAHMQEAAIVLAAQPPGSVPKDSEGEPTSGGEESGGQSSSSTASEEPVQDAGCGCAASPTAPTWGLLGLGLLVRRRPRARARWRGPDYRGARRRAALRSR